MENILLKKLSFNPAYTLISLHVPKAAGSTLSFQILSKQYHKDYVFSPTFHQDHQDINILKNMSDEEKRKLQLIQGHYSFGIHEVLNSSFSYMTMLRDPVDRVISLYFYIKRRSDHPFHERVQDVSLQDFIVQKLTTEANNGQVRQLSGVIWEGTNPQFWECTSELLDRAKFNLDNYFSSFGIIERFDESIMLMRRVYGWSTPFYNRVNVTQERPLRDEFDDKTIKLIQDCNELDIELYDYANSKFNLLIEQVPMLNAEVIEFQKNQELISRSNSFSNPGISKEVVQYFENRIDKVSDNLKLSFDSFERRLAAIEQRIPKKANNQKQFIRKKLMIINKKSNAQERKIRALVQRLHHRQKNIEVLSRRVAEVEGNLIKISLPIWKKILIQMKNKFNLS